MVTAQEQPKKISSLGGSAYGGNHGWTRMNTDKEKLFSAQADLPLARKTNRDLLHFCQYPCQSVFIRGKNILFRSLCLSAVLPRQAIRGE